MSSILLATWNARYPHSAFGLRYLLANMGELRSETELLEFGIQDRSVDVLEQVLQRSPQILGLGIYIWNVAVATRFVAELKRVRPDIVVVLGGPEVSYEWETQPIVELADYVIAGEADLAFATLCRDLREDRRPPEKIIAAPVPEPGQLALPYIEYTAEDIAHRVIYVEASRGCPFTCEFCLSALDIPVRAFPLDAFLAAMQVLLDRGVRQFKFVDRTFNLNLRVSRDILSFFLECGIPDLFLHFEMIPDRLPEPLRELIVRFPPGMLQFEIGVQTLNPDVGERISRRQDNDKLAENFRFLREQTGVHIHSDLILGLPGETLESFADGFDRLLALGPHEIQVGMLKRLRGTPIQRHEFEWKLVYSPEPPYELLQNSTLDFQTLHRLRRFARYWDLIGNSGNFVASRAWIWHAAASPFAAFLDFSDWLFQREQRTHGIALPRLLECVFTYCVERSPEQTDSIAADLWRDYTRGGREDRPHFLRSFDLPPARDMQRGREGQPQRQARHWT
ncbi:MAG: B12-binding domain-containing radical SAM protein [Planctomycetaceae bacterium]|nr:B12-binding domain-containing radical SAM protein [Planctomycetaceae bacterium]